MKAAFFVLLFVTLGGCATPLAQLRKDIGPAAADWHECPEDKLTFEEMQRLFTTTRVKVTGCNKTSQWVFEESKWNRDRNAR